MRYAVMSSSESGTYRFHAKELDASRPPDQFSSARSAPGVDEAGD